MTRMTPIRHILPMLAVLLSLCGCQSYHQPDKTIDVAPVIYPDYTDVTFPTNIAPPNFIIQEEGSAYQVEIGREGKPAEILITADEPTVRIPEKAWKALLEASSGENIYFRICIQQEDEWIQYADIKDSISAQPIDPYLVYRLLYPGYELWNNMGIYQRDLTGYEETPVMENQHFDKHCVNCHTFNQQSPSTMMVHVRGPQGGTLINRNGKISKINPKPKHFKYGATYPAWHPSGNYIAFSTNEIQQFFHSSGKKTIEVSDLGADLMVYNLDTRFALSDTLVYGNDYMETFPAWAPDGKSLYFCRAPGYRKGMALDSIRYDLYRIQFDEANKRLHSLECVYEPSKTKQSVSFPRISPDGKYLLFTQSDYGNFSIWHKESDLYLLDLATGKVRCLDKVNSEDVDSYHSWSSNGHWFVFSSKRMDGLWARPYLASFDPATGETGKPFLLPQENPEFYDSYTYTFNVPELIKEPIKIGEQLEKAVYQDIR